MGWRDTVKGSLMRWLLTSDNVPNGFTVQTHPVEVGGYDYIVGATTPGFAPPPVFVDVISTAPWGSDDPQAFVDVHNWGVPPAGVQIKNGGAPEMLMTNAPQGGNC